MSKRVAIQNGIRAIALSSAHYRKVSYDPNGVASEGADPLSPSSVRVNEAAATFADSSDGTKLQRLRSSWRFECYVDFPCEATVERFEELINDNPDGNISITPEGGTLLILLIAESAVSHPQQNQGHGEGTKAVFVVEAIDPRMIATS